MLRTVELPKTNNPTVIQEIIKLMSDICDGTDDYNRLRSFLSDTALYAVKAISKLKGIFPNHKHVTCLAHMVHRSREKNKMHRSR